MLLNLSQGQLNLRGGGGIAVRSSKGFQWQLNVSWLTGRAYRSSAPEALPPPPPHQDQNLLTKNHQPIPSEPVTESTFRSQGASLSWKLIRWQLRYDSEFSEDSRTFTISSGSVSSVLIVEDGMCGHSRTQRAYHLENSLMDALCALDKMT